MDSQTSLLVSSVVINILLIIERFLKRITKSECCGSKVELERSTSVKEFSNIQVENNEYQSAKQIVSLGEPLQTITTEKSVELGK